MVGNQIELFLLQGPQKNLGASLVLLLSLVLMFFMAYYLILTPAREPGGTMTVAEAPRTAPHPAGRPTAAAVAQPLAPPVRPCRHHLGLHRVVAGPGARGGAVLVQRRSLAERLARLLHAVVLLCRRIRRRGPQPAAARWRTASRSAGHGADRDPAGRDAGDGAHAVAVAGEQGVQRHRPGPAGHAGDRRRVGALPGDGQPLPVRPAGPASDAAGPCHVLGVLRAGGRAVAAAEHRT